MALKCPFWPSGLHLCRSLRMEAKEQGKLLQDKAALEVKLHEQVATLELVQTQRNELKQSYKVCRHNLYQDDHHCS